MAYVDIATLQTIAAGQPLSAATVQQIRDNGEFFIDPPACSIFNNGTQNVTSGGGNTVLTADSENYDNNSMHSTASNTSRITIQTAGRYLLIATIVFPANASGFRRGSILHNGTTSYGGLSGIVDSSNSGVRLTSVRTLVLAASDYVEATAHQTSGSTLAVTLEEFVAIFLTR